MKRFCFQLNEILENGFVSGRNCGSSIPVGAQFDSVFKETFFEEKNKQASSKICFEEKVRIKLLQVHFCGKVVSEVPEGHTAELEFSSDVLADLKVYLDQCEKHEYITLKG